MAAVRITEDEARELLGHVGLEPRHPQAGPPICPACGHGNKPFAHYCNKCGTKLDQLLPRYRY